MKDANTSEKDQEIPGISQTEAAMHEPRKVYEAPQLVALELLSIVQGTGTSITDGGNTRHN